MPALAWIDRSAGPVCALLLLLTASVSTAQERPSASLLRTSAGEGVREGLGGALDRIVRSRLDALEAVRVRGSVALDVSEVQLALGCVGETPECLSQVAEQLGVQILLLPNLDRAGDELLLSIARYDTGSDELRRVAREASGPEAENEILDAVDGLLRELFGLPEPPPEPVAAVGAGSAGAGAGAGVEREPQGPGGDVQPPPPAAEPQIAGPAIVLGLGAGTLVAGVVTGVLFLQESDAYAEAPQTLEDFADRESHRATAEDLALATNVLLISGGVVAAAGLGWLIAEVVGAGGGEESGESQTSIAPILGPQVAGLEVSGRLPEIR